MSSLTTHNATNTVGPSRDNSADEFFRSIEARVSTLEANQERLLDDVHTTADSLEKHAERTSSAIESIISKLASVKAPQWGIMASWAGVILVVVSLLLASYGKDQTRIEDALKAQQAVLDERAKIFEELRAADAQLLSRQNVVFDIFIPDIKKHLETIDKQIDDINRELVIHTHPVK